MSLLCLHKSGAVFKTTLEGARKESNGKSLSGTNGLCCPAL